MINTIKNMAVIGIISDKNEDLFKVAVWDSAFLNICYKICTAEEMNNLVSEFIPIDSYNIHVLKKKLITVEYNEIFDSMRYAWIEENYSFMYSYFDCLRWCLNENISVSAMGQKVDRNTIRVDLNTLKVFAGDLEIFSFNKKVSALPLSIDIASMDQKQYEIASREFNLDGTESVFEYKPVEYISTRSTCSILCNYAKKQGCIGQLYALDQILGEA